MTTPGDEAAAPPSWTRDEVVSVICRGLTLSCFAFLVALGARAKHWVHPDCSMYLQTGSMLLDGKVPFVDFVEINPPLVMYLSVIPVAIARAIGAPIVAVFNVLLALFAGYGAWAWLRHLPRIAPRISEPYRHVVANVWLGFSFLVLIAGHWSLPVAVTGTDYGQREHLIVLGYVPFLLLRMVRWRTPGARLSGPESIVAGALAGLVLCLKPQFIGAAALVELYLLLENKRYRALLRPEVYSACAVGLLYALHFALVPTAMRDAFFGRWLPLASSRYRAYHWGWGHVLSLKTLHASVVLVVALFLPWREPYRSIARRAAPLAIFGFGSSVVMIAQHKGWPYHVIPMAAGIYLTLAMVLTEVMQHQVAETPEGDGQLARVQRGLLVARAPLCILLVGAWFASVVAHSPVLFRPYRTKTLSFIRKVTQADDAVAYLSTAVQTVYPEAYHSRRNPGSRYLWTFPLAYLFEGRSEKAGSREALYTVPAGREEEERQLIDDLVEDMLQRKPKLVFIWRGAYCQGCPPGFVIAEYLRRKDFHHRGLGDYFETHRMGHWEVWARSDVDLPRRAGPRGKRR